MLFIGAKLCMFILIPPSWKSHYVYQLKHDFLWIHNCWRNFFPLKNATWDPSWFASSLCPQIAFLKQWAIYCDRPSWPASLERVTHRCNSQVHLLHFAICQMFVVCVYVASSAGNYLSGTQILLINPGITSQCSLTVVLPFAVIVYDPSTLEAPWILLRYLVEFCTT